MRIIKSDLCDQCPHHSEGPCGCQQGHDKVDIDPSLNNPSLEHEEEHSESEMPKRVMLIKMVGDTKDINIEDILKMIENVLPAAENAGMDEEAERLQMAASKLEKAAEYEGWGVFWIANGRAFEKSYKEKKEEKGDAPNAATEAWMETLEEYQKALLNDTFDFTEKYASKKAKETADMGGGAGGGAAVMGPGQLARVKELKKKKDKEGLTEGEAISEWLDEQQGRKKKAASVMLLNKISARMERGSSPGVAVYEAIDDLQNMSNTVKKEAIAELGHLYCQALSQNKEALKEVLAFGLWDRITSPLKGVWENFTGGIGDFFSRQWAQGGSLAKKMRQINRLRPIIQKKLNEFLKSLTVGETISADDVLEALNTKNFYPTLVDFLNGISKVVGKRPSDFLNPNNFTETGTLNNEQYNQFLAEFVLAMQQVNEENVNRAFYSKSTTDMPDTSKLTYQEDMKLQKNILRLSNYLNTITNHLRMAIPPSTPGAASPVSNIFDPSTLNADLNAMGISSLMSNAMMQINKGVDAETVAFDISSEITDKLEEKVTNYYNNVLQPLIQNLAARMTAAGRGPNARLLSQQYHNAYQASEKIIQKWELTKTEIEKEVLKTITSRYNKLTGARQNLIKSVTPQQQAAPRPAGA